MGNLNTIIVLVSVVLGVVLTLLNILELSRKLALPRIVKKLLSNATVAWVLLVVVLIGFSVYLYLIEPETPGCSDYGIQITSPVAGDRVKGGDNDVIGSYKGSPLPGSIVVIVRSPDGSRNWPSATPVQTDPILGAWKGVASLAGEPPQNYNIAVAYVGKSGRALIEYYYKVGRETGQWPAIGVLPDDVEICAQVSVVTK